MLFPRKLIYWINDTLHDIDPVDLLLTGFGIGLVLGAFVTRLVVAFVYAWAYP